jgi:hypothetical protein
MAGEIARGLGSGAMYAINGGVLDTTKVDIPGIMTAEAGAESDTDELRAENRIIAVATDAPRGTGSMTWGRMNFAALVVANGGIVETDGVAPDEINRHILSGSPITAEFMLVVQTDSLDVEGSGYRLVIPRVKCSPFGDALDQNAWNNPSADIQYLPNAANELLIREQFQTMVPIGTAYPS